MIYLLWPIHGGQRLVCQKSQIEIILGLANNILPGLSLTFSDCSLLAQIAFIGSFVAKLNLFWPPEFYNAFDLLPKLIMTCFYPVISFSYSIENIGIVSLISEMKDCNIFFVA